MYTPVRIHVSTRGEYNRRRDQLEPVAEEGSLAAEPPQDTRCTFCVNIWNDFEIMIAIFGGAGDERGISRVLSGCGAERKSSCEEKGEVREKEERRWK